MELNKRGIFFSIDALIALAVIILGVLIVYPIANTTHKESYSQRDLINALSDIKIGQLNNSIALSLISSGQVTNVNRTVLEEIAELSVLNETLAISLASSILSSINTNENIGIWFGDKLVASKNSTPYDNSKDIVIQSQKISGIKEGDSVAAYSGRAFLTNSMQSRYFYFGGYVGEGNVSAIIDYTGNISYAEMEIATIQNFSLYVNGIFQTNLNGSSSSLTPKRYVIPINSFTSGENLVELKSNFSLGIAGGFIKVSYKPDVSYFNQTKKRYLPGVDRAINIYDGLYIPGKLNSLKIFLRYQNNFSTIMRIGDKIVFNGTSNTTQNVTINNTYLSSVLNYSDISEKTVPLRLGLANGTYVTNFSIPADVFSVADLSGSMAPTPSSCSLNKGCCKNGVCDNNQTKCVACGGTFTPAEDKIGTLKNATKQFIQAVLNDSKNRVGLVGYNNTVYFTTTYNLSRNDTALNKTVNSWGPAGNTCICCGINWAVDNMTNSSPSTSFRSLVVMSDGDPNVGCARQPNATAAADAIQAACDAYQKYNIKVYAVAFGSDANEATMQSIANCGGGSYYYGGVDSLESVYADIAKEIIDASFHEQTLNITGNYTSYLSPYSYIEYDYNASASQYGLITTTERKFYNTFWGNFSVPQNATLLEAILISYSGSRWTNEVRSNNVEIYNLTKYGEDYLELGDPYSITIPLSYLNVTNNTNNISLTTGLSKYNVSGGSSDNKIIYTIIQKNTSIYSPLLAYSNGCNWTVMFEDGQNYSANFPSSYSGSNKCYYLPSNITVENSNDALQVAVKKLLQLLDYDSNGKLDVKFSDQDLDISSSQTSGIPYDWSTEVQVRTWS